MKIAKFALAASILALAACSNTGNGGAKMQSYDEQAPYAHERTAGAETVAVDHKADKIYNTHQNK
jgi:hypothetical protein